MPLDLLSIFLGFVLGTAATAIAWNLTQRSVRNPETARLTAVWSLKDLAEPGQRPVVLAEQVEGLSVPAGSKVIVPSGRLDSVSAEVLQTCEVRMHPEVRVNAAVGKDRALVFSGRVSPKATALFTMEAGMVSRLQGDFQRMWTESTPYIESVQVSELGAKAGRVVDVTGRALEALEFRGKKMMKLTDGKVMVGVVSAQDDVSKFQGSVVRVVGRMHKDGGYSYIEAQRVELVGAAATA